MEKLKYPLKFINAPTPNLKYKAYTLKNIDQLPQYQNLSDENKFELQVVGSVLPFKTNNYVVEELIHWKNAPNDPIYTLTFPRRDMLKPHHFDRVATAIKQGASQPEIKRIADEIRWELDPHPAGQLEHNVPCLYGEKLQGMQHKYNETVLFFPSQGQTCHAFCTFCFRWPQFVGIDELKFGMREVELLIEYLRQHPEVSDVLFTGGDPLIMRTKTMAKYIDALLSANLPNLRSIRIGTKSLAYWPYRFLTDSDSEELLALFSKVTHAGKHLAIMAHFNHPRELETEAVGEAIRRIRMTGAQIRTQSPILAHINAKPEIWINMWRKQVALGCIPYYMFVARNTGAQHYFGISLVEAWQIYRKAYQKVSGLARTVRGPSMSAHPGKIHIVGVGEVRGEKVFILRFLQGRNSDWVLRPFFAKYDASAIWLDQIKASVWQGKILF